MASISSMNTIEGARLRASWNRSRTRAAPTPTNSSTKLLPVTEMNGTWASPATAHAPPRGPAAPAPPVPLRVLQEVDPLADLTLDPLVAGHIGKGGVGPFG